MLKIKLPGKKNMESNGEAKSKRSLSKDEIKNMKKKSSTAIVRNSGQLSLVIPDTDKRVANDTKRNKSTEEIVIHERKSHSINDFSFYIKGNKLQGSKELIAQQKKIANKNVDKAKSKGDAKLEPIVATSPSSINTTDKSKTHEAQNINKDIAENAKYVITASNVNKTSHLTMMTRGRLKKILESKYGVSAADYLRVQNIEKHFNLQDLRKPGQRKRSRSPMKTQVKKMKI